MEPEAATGSRSRPVRTAVLIGVAVLVGLVARSVVADGSDSPLVSWLPWNNTESVTFFYGDQTGDYIVPVSRSVGGGDTEPAALVEAFLAGPEPSSGLTRLIPAETVATQVALTEGVLTVDLAGSGFAEASLLTHESAYQSMRLWPDVTDVVITVDGVEVETNTTGHLLYFYDEARDMLVAQPTNRVRPGDLVEAYLEGPTDEHLIGLPDGIEVQDVELGSNELLTLRFNFPEQLRTFAVDHPDSVRRVLEALIATFNTGFPDVGGVLLDFDGHNALGLGQCANLLNTVQTMPEILNDERLLARYALAP